jgi:hypothetical protein
MGLRGSRLTVVLVAVLVLVVGAGIAGAVAVGRSASAGTGTTPGGTGSGGSSAVEMTPAAERHPRAEEIRLLLQQYFDAINSRDYPVWAASVSAAQSQGRPESEWSRSYSTTKDSKIKVIDIMDDPLRVRLWFTSEQAVELAPSDLPVKCINWDVTYDLVDEGSLRIGTTVPTATNKAACA